MSSRVTFHDEPTSRSRVRIHDQPGIQPGSRHTRVEVGVEGQIIQRHDGMKTRITMGAVLPQQSGPNNVQLHGQDELNTRVQIHGPPTVAPDVALALVHDKTPQQIVDELSLRLQQDELSVKQAAKRLDQTKDEFEAAFNNLSDWKDKQAELAAEAKRKQDEAIAEAVSEERAKLEASEQAEFTRLRAKLEDRRAEFDAAKQGAAPDPPTADASTEVPASEDD